MITLRALWLATFFVTLAALPVCAQPQAPPTLAPSPLQLPLGSPTPAPGPEPARRGPIVVTPTIAITGEWNDNIFQSNANKVSDFILGITPGVSVVLEQPTYRLLGSYSLTSEIYADQEQLNDAVSQQNLRLDASWRATQRLTLSVSDVFTVSNNSNAVTTEAVSTGRTESLSNTLTVGGSYLVDPRTTLRTSGTWNMQRYDTAGALDSNTYAAEAFVDYAFTARLTGTGGYQFAYFDVDESPGVTTHTPRVGVSYRFTPTITGLVNGGPTIQVPEDGSAGVFPAVTAAVQSRYGWGSATVQYDHAVGTAGGLGGTTENQALGATIQADRLARGLIVQFVPRYTRSTSTAGNAVDVDAFSLTLQGRYEINRYVAAVAGYTHFMQRSSSTVVSAAGTITANDVDQNRVFVGLQFGYPIRMD